MIDESAEEFSTLESIQRRVLWLAVRMIDHNFGYTMLFGINTAFALCPSSLDNHNNSPPIHDSLPGSITEREADAFDLSLLSACLFKP